MNASNFKQANKTHFAVTVQFDVVPARFEEFLLLVNANAKRSVELESGCLQFDVLVTATVQDRKGVFLYEVYATAEDFTAHLSTPHFLSFDQETQGMLLSKSVTTYVVFGNKKASGH
jgi:(4S)-4-hydroxy-5-phosphonooxypentane-2,3-dione isomerase